MWRRHGSRRVACRPRLCTTPNALIDSSATLLPCAVAGARVYVTMFPCNECAKLMIQVGAGPGVGAQCGCSGRYLLSLFVMMLATLVSHPFLFRTLPTVFHSPKIPPSSLLCTQAGISEVVYHEDKDQPSRSDSTITSGSFKYVGGGTRGAGELPGRVGRGIGPCLPLACCREMKPRGVNTGCQNAHPACNTCAAPSLLQPRPAVRGVPPPAGTGRRQAAAAPLLPPCPALPRQRRAPGSGSSGGGPCCQQQARRQRGSGGGAPRVCSYLLSGSGCRARQQRQQWRWCRWQQWSGGGRRRCGGSRQQAAAARAAAALAGPRWKEHAAAAAAAGSCAPSPEPCFCLSTCPLAIVTFCYRKWAAESRSRN